MGVTDEKSERSGIEPSSSETDFLWPTEQSWVDFCFLF
jgi:hypothetical protein